MIEGKIPPQCIDIENAILGTFLLERVSWEMIDRLTEDMFYKEQNKIVFSAIKMLFSEKREIDMLTVTEQLNKMQKLDQVGVTYLSELTKNISSARHLEYHVHIFIEKYIQRSIIRQCTEILEDSYCDTLALDEIIGKVETLYKSSIDEIDRDMPVFNINDVIDQSRDLAYKRMIDLENGKLPGIPINLGVLQEIIGGWQLADLIYIAARPSMGKTAVACHFAKHAARKGFKVLFFSLEMNKIALTDRMILGETGIEPDRWRNGTLSDSDFKLIEEKRSEFNSWKLFINDKAKLRIEDIEIVCKKLHPDIVFIDYIQLMRVSRGVKYDNRNLELGNISHGLKAIAKDFNIPVVCCCQLNRDVDKRGSKIPSLSDLRDSGELEQDADIVIFPYRPYVHVPDEANKGVIEFYISKHRNGKIGMTKAMHNEYINDFYDNEF